MRHFSVISFAVMLTFMTVSVNMTSSAVDSAVKQTPVYQEFDENEVNGAVIVNVPKNSVADVLITFTSPEVTDEIYYDSNLQGGKSYSFDIEGRDNTEFDYRNYKVSIEITGGEYNITSSAFVDEITVPDVNDNPDSYVEYVYNCTIDGEKSDNEWDIVSQKGNEKNLAVHLNSITMGDINSDGIVDANDASLVLAEYSLLSTGDNSAFDSRQKLQADVNHDDIINANDASKILEYYSKNSTGGNASWDEI